jgi:hypothetical protein
MEAKQAAETDPTYPKPKMLIDKPKRILLVTDSSRATGLFYELSMNYTNPRQSIRQMTSVAFFVRDFLQILWPVRNLAGNFFIVNALWEPKNPPSASRTSHYPFNRTALASLALKIKV